MHDAINKRLGHLTSLVIDGGVSNSLSRQPLTSAGILVRNLSQSESVELRDQHSRVQRQDTVDHGILGRHGDVLLVLDGRHVRVEGNADQGIGGVVAEQGGGQEPQGRTILGGGVGDVQEAGVHAQHGVLELEEGHGA